MRVNSAKVQRNQNDRPLNCSCHFLSAYRKSVFLWTSDDLDAPDYLDCEFILGPLEYLSTVTPVRSITFLLAAAHIQSSLKSIVLVALLDYTPT